MHGGEAMTGWICTRCNASNAPTLTQCPCSPPMQQHWYRPSWLGPYDPVQPHITWPAPGTITWTSTSTDITLPPVQSPTAEDGQRIAEALRLARMTYGTKVEQ